MRTNQSNKEDRAPSATQPEAMPTAAIARRKNFFFTATPNPIEISLPSTKTFNVLKLERIYANSSNTQGASKLI